MTDLQTFWFNKDTARSYNKKAQQTASGVVDEIIIAEFINNYLFQKEKIIVDLGIGPGRELAWLDKVSGIKKIIGVDFSPAMLEVCSERVKDCSHKIDLINDDLLKPKTLPEIVGKETKTVIYISLINSFGNFTSKERLIVLKNMKKFLKTDDRIILSIYKRSQQVKLETLIKKAPYLTTKDPSEQSLLAEVIEYGSIGFLWNSVIEKYGQLPTFWYDKENHDVVIHMNGERLYISHRFSREEIEEEFREAGLEVDQIIEGKAMYIAVGKKLV